MSEDQIEIVETSIDDMNPELFGHLMDRLFEDGALDVYWIPVYMKKNRPGTMLQVLCKIEHREKLIHRILSETTTLGVRYYPSRRRLLRAGIRGGKDILWRYSGETDQGSTGKYSHHTRI